VAALTGLLAWGVRPDLLNAIPGWPAELRPLRAPIAAAGWALLAGALLLLGRRRPGLFGLRRPAGRDAWRLLPLACLGAALGGAWWPGGLVGAAGAVGLPEAATLLCVALGIETAFRGEALGILATRHEIQRPGGRWFVSVPVLFTTLLYTAAHGLASGPPQLLAAPLLSALPAWLLPPAGAALFGLALGLARERSESVLVPMALHVLGLALVVAGGLLAL
jgi:hypothetical protein